MEGQGFQERRVRRYMMRANQTATRAKVSEVNMVFEMEMIS